LLRTPMFEISSQNKQQGVGGLHRIVLGAWCSPSGCNNNNNKYAYPSGWDAVKGRELLLWRTKTLKRRWITKNYITSNNLSIKNTLCKYLIFKYAYFCIKYHLSRLVLLRLFTLIFTINWDSFHKEMTSWIMSLSLLK
jgi:hypothetical protein